MEKLTGRRVSINAFSSKIACGSRINSPMDCGVLLKRYANQLVRAGTAPPAPFVTPVPGADFITDEPEGFAVATAAGAGFCVARLFQSHTSPAPANNSRIRTDHFTTRAHISFSGEFSG